MTDDVAAVVMVPRLLTVAHAAVVLDCSPDTVRRRIADGSLSAVRDGQGRVAVRGDDLRRYIDAMDRVGQTIRSRPLNRPRRRYGYLHE
jgi:excisionase family DNA binding protein